MTEQTPDREWQCPGWRPPVDNRGDRCDVCGVRKPYHAAVVRAAQADAHPGRLCNAVCVVDGCADLASRPSAAQADETTTLRRELLRSVQAHGDQARDALVVIERLRAEAAALREEADRAPRTCTACGTPEGAAHHEHRDHVGAAWQINRATSAPAALRAAQPGREQVARAIYEAHPWVDYNDQAGPVVPPRVVAWDEVKPLARARFLSQADSVLDLFRQDQP